MVQSVPRPYGVNDLHLIYSGISFGEADSERVGITPPKEGIGTPAGAYIAYERIRYGDEKHAYVSFSVEEEYLETMREFFFEFAKIIPGRYVDTQRADI